MSTHIYKLEDGSNSEPVNIDEITELWNSGEISSDTAVCEIGGNWQTVKDLGGTNSGRQSGGGQEITQTNHGFCTECGLNLDENQTCQNIDCVEYTKVGGSAFKSEVWPKAPLGRRIGGIFLERFLMWMLEVVGTLLSPFTFAITGVLTSIINAFYATFRDSSAGKFSIEKIVGKLMVVDVETGKPASLGQAIGRNFYYSLGWILALLPTWGIIGLIAYFIIFAMYVIDFLVIICHPQGRRVGDLIAGTQVVPLKSN